MNLAKYPDLMTPEEVAEVLRRYKPSMIKRLKGLRKTRVGNGRGKVVYRKEDVRDYIKAKVEREEVRENACKQEKGHRKMGISTLLSLQELQKA